MDDGCLAVAGDEAGSSGSGATGVGCRVAEMEVSWLWRTELDTVAEAAEGNETVHTCEEK